MSQKSKQLNPNSLLNFPRLIKLQKQVYFLKPSSNESREEQWLAVMNLFNHPTVVLVQTKQLNNTNVGQFSDWKRMSWKYYITINFKELRAETPSNLPSSVQLDIDANFKAFSKHPLWKFLHKSIQTKQIHFISDRISA